MPAKGRHLVDDDPPKAGVADDGYSLDTAREGEVEDVADEASHVAEERTGLLSAGSRDSRGGAVAPQDSWAGLEEFEGLPWWRTPSVYWLLGPYALFTLAFGGTLVPKLNLIIDLVCRRYFAEKSATDPSFVFTPVVLGGDNPQCTIPQVQRNVATFTLVLNVVTGILSAYTAPKIGTLSDRYGRRRMLALTSSGGVLGELVTIFAAKYPDVIHYNWLVLGVVFDGLAGSFTAGSVLSTSYTSDCTPPSKRGVAIGYLHSCLFSGLAFGPLLAGYFVKWTGSLLSIFYVTLGCHIFFIIFVLLFIPESVSKRRQHLAREKHELDEEARRQRTKAWAVAYQADAQEPSSFLRSLFLGPRAAKCLASLRSANPFEPLQILTPAGRGNSRVRRNLCLLAVIDMIILGAAMSSGQATLLYSEYMFHWGNFETSRFLSLISMVRVFVLMAIFPIINYFFRIRPAARRRRESGAIPERNAGADELDVWIIRFAILSDALGAAGYIFARSEAFFVLSGIVSAFGGLGSATIQTALSKHVSAERVGQLLGAIGLLHALSRIAAPIVFNGIYAATVQDFPQAIFVALAGMFLLVLSFSLLVRPHVYLKEDIGAQEEGEEGSEPSPAPTRRLETLTDDEIVPQI